MKQQLIIVLLFVGTIGFGQGMVVHAGGTSMKSEMKTMTPDGSAQTGYHIGADGRLGDDDFYFLIGLGFHHLNFNAQEDFTFKTEGPNLNILKGKGGFAFKLFRINEDIVTRFRAFGAVDYLLKIPALDADHQLSNVNFNEAVGGLGGGIEIDIYFMTLGLEYQKGFFNSVNETPDTSLDFLTFSAGINF